MERFDVRGEFFFVVGSQEKVAESISRESGNIPLSNVNLSKDLKKRWKVPGDEKNTNIPGVYAGRIPNMINLQDGKSYNVYDMWGQSDVMVVNADFLRCQQMSLTWNMNEEWCAKNRSEKFIA